MTRDKKNDIDNENEFQNNVMGRPKEKISDKVDLKQVERLAGLGLTNVEIGRALNLSVKTIEKYSKDEEFYRALKRGKEIADRAVAKSLYKRALGYKFNEVTTEHIEVGENKTPAKKIKTVTKQVVPDTTAQIFWLKNRRPDLWRDVRQVEANTNIRITQDAGVSETVAWLRDAAGRGEEKEIKTIN